MNFPLLQSHSFTQKGINVFILLPKNCQEIQPSMSKLAILIIFIFRGEFNRGR